MVAISVFKSRTKLEPQLVLDLSTAVRDLNAMKLQLNLGKLFRISGRCPGFNYSPTIAFAVTVKEAKGPEIGFLYDIARVVVVAGEPACKVVNGIEMRKH
jgi:hypothetical protein